MSKIFNFLFIVQKILFFNLLREGQITTAEADIVHCNNNYHQCGYTLVSGVVDI